MNLEVDTNMRRLVQTHLEKWVCLGAEVLQHYLLLFWHELGQLKQMWTNNGYLNHWWVELEPFLCQIFHDQQAHSEYYCTWIIWIFLEMPVSLCQTGSNAKQNYQLYWFCWILILKFFGLCLQVNCEKFLTRLAKVEQH